MQNLDVNKLLFQQNRDIQMELFVSSDGNDRHKGTYHKPLKTMSKAQDIIRSVNNNMHGDIVVYLREGTYELKNTILFDERDSASNGYFIIYTNWQEERPIISGGRKIRIWQKKQMKRNGFIWQADVCAIQDIGNLFVDGSVATPARSAIKETKAWDTVTESDFVLHNQVETFNNGKEDIPVYDSYLTTHIEMLNWENQKDIVFVYDVGWTHSICPVDSISPYKNGAIVKMRMPCFRDCQIKPGVHISGPSYIENALELLDEPGKWYYHKSLKILYYMTSTDEDMNQKEVIAPCLETLVTIKGRMGAPVENIVFHGIEFRNTSYLRPRKTGHAEIQANLIKDPENDGYSSYLKTPAAITMDCTKAVNFSCCRFEYMGGCAMDIQHGSYDNTVSDCKFHLIAANGIQMGGFTMKDAHPEDFRHIVRNIQIINNYFNDIGYEYKGSVAILAGYVSGISILHNEISNVAYSGISVGWGWGIWDVDAYENNLTKPSDNLPFFRVPTIAAGNKINYNHIHHVMQKLHDGGGIYTLSMQADSSIIGNLIHDNGSYNADGYKNGLLVGGAGQNEDELSRVTRMAGFPGGIYLDEGTGGFEVSGNIVYNVTVPIFYHKTVRNRFETNRIADNYTQIKPGEEGYPTAIAEIAGVIKHKNYSL